MLTISEGQLAALTRETMLDRMCRFLTERSPDAGLQAVLRSPTECREFWLPWYEHFAGMDEHGLAVRLSYLLAARVHGFDVDLAQSADEDAELAMKCLLEDHGVLPFIAFDEG